MTYHLDRTLFVENGPSLLVERDRRRRAAGQAYRLLNAPRPGPEAADDTTQFSVAA